MPSSAAGSSARLHFQPGHLQLGVYPAELRQALCSALKETTCPSREGGACTWAQCNKCMNNIPAGRLQTELSGWQDLQKLPQSR